MEYRNLGASGLKVPVLSSSLTFPLGLQWSCLRGELLYET